MKCVEAMVDARCERTLVDASVCQQHYCVSKASSHYKTVKRTISTFALIIGGPELPDLFALYGNGLVSKKGNENTNSTKDSSV